MFGASVSSFPVVDAVPYLSASDVRSEHIVAARDAAAPNKQDVASLGPRLSAESALVVDASSGAVLFHKKAHEERSLASITKLMTALVFLEQEPDLATRVTMEENDDREGGNQHIRPGESATLRSYLRASLVGSANNATVVLSRSTDFSFEEFIARMNEKAWELGMRNTVFIEPTGLAPENRSTARDLARLLEAVMQNDTVREMTSTHRTTIVVYPSGVIRQVDSTNHLIGSIVSVAAGKTGYLDESLYNVASAVTLSNNKQIYVIVLGAQSNDERVQDAKNLAVWAEATYDWKTQQ